VSWRLGNCQVKISNRFCSFRELNNCEYISRALENIEREYKKSQLKRVLGLCEPKYHKTWFDSQFLDQSKHAKMQLLQKSNQSNVDNLTNVRHDGY
jgi:hypothetical protein